MTDDRPKPRQLGRGLSALLGDVPPPGADAPALRPTDLVPIEHLRAGRLQPRRDFSDEELDALAQSIAERGILQPILVRPDRDAPGRFEIVAGERRWRAAQRAKLHEVPVILRDIPDRAALEIAIVENVQRQDLAPLEEAEGYRRLIDEFEHTQDSLARAVGKSRSHVGNIVRLLNLPEAVRTMLRDGTLSSGHARPLLNAADPERIARQVAKRGLNVRQTERLVNDEEGAGRALRRAARRKKDRDTLALEWALCDLLGLNVTIEGKGERGRLILQYTSLDQLDGILRKLGYTG